MELCAIYEPPKSVSKKVKNNMINGIISKETKPDLDNICKSVADSLNQIAYADDASIDEIHAYKMYGERSCCQVKLTDERHVIKPLWFLEEN